MIDPEITFEGVELDQRQCAEVRQALRRIRSEGTAGAWPSRVDHIAVTSIMSDGQSGALVLGIEVCSGDYRSARVAKIDSAAPLAAEWRSYDKWIKPDANRFFAPIIAATPDVVSPTGLEWGPGAIVYAHAAQFDGRPDVHIRPLEDLVRAACNGSAPELDHVLRVIKLLLEGAANLLHRKRELNRQPSSLRSMNPGLGPNAVLDVGAPRDPDYDGRAWQPDDVLLARTTGGAEPAQFAPGDYVALHALRPDPDGRPGIARGDHIAVEIRPAEQWAALASRSEFAVFGRIVTTRGAALRSRMLDALRDLGPVDPADDGWNVAGTVVANPFQVLLDVLTSQVPGRVQSVIHGDLNPRNALVVEDQPYLIDYSHTAEGPQQADFCWLELGLVRDVFAGLGFPALVVLQRWLALAARVLDHTGGHAMAVVTALADLVRRQAPDLAVPFRVLLEIRRCGRLVHPAQAGPSWHRDYLEQLLLAAHRTAKWTHAVQTPTRMRSTVAVASVATEHLAEQNAFAWWTDRDLAAALATVEPVLPLADDDAVRLVHDVAAAMSKVDDRTEAVLVSARERLVRDRSAGRARNLLAEQDRNDGYIDLVAAPADGRDEADVFTLVAPEPVVTVCGAPGSGKTMILREAAYRLANAILDMPAYDANGPGALSVRAPVPVDAAHLAQLLAADDDPVAVVRGLLADSGLAGIAASAFALGMPYLLVDNIDQLGSADRRSVLGWLAESSRRYPRLRMLVGQRQPVEPAEFASAVLRLRDLDVAGMRALLRRAFTGTVVRGSYIDRLLRVLLEEPEWQRLHPERPGVLAMVVRHIREFGVSDQVIAPADIIVEQLLGVGSAREPRTDDLALVCERIAVRLLDDRADDISAQSAGHPDVSDSDGLLDHLVDREVLRRHGDRVAFADRTYQDYFAALALRRGFGAAPVDYVRRPNWHSALRFFVTLPGVTDQPKIRSGLVRAAWHVAPVLTAHLIRDCGCDDTSARMFADSCRAVLVGDDADDYEIGDTTAALGVLGERFGWATLASVVTAAECRTDSRVAALWAMAVPRGRTAGIGDWLASVVLALVVGPCPVALRVAALRVIAAEGLRGLELYISQFVAPTEPWPVVRAAAKTLQALGTALPQQHHDAYQSACQHRLAEVDQALDGRLTPRGATEYLDERADLLVELSGPDAWSTLLAHLFDFQASRRVAAALDRAISLDTTPDPCPRYWQILVGNTAPADLVRIAVGGEPLDAAAAAHRLLRHAPDHAMRALIGIKASAPNHRLLIAAALVAEAGDTGLTWARNLFLELLPTVDNDRLIGAAALVCAIFAQDAELGIRLAWHAADVLADQGLAERHNWPWVQALTRCRGNVVELSNLIETGDDTAVLAETALASRDFPRRCDPGRRLSFRPAARRRMLARKPDSGDRELARWAMAAANMDLVEALPELQVIAADLARRPYAVAIGTAHSGLVHWSPFADVLVVLGFLARRAFDQHATPVDGVYRLLSDPDVPDAHSSIRIARLIGKAYLGDCLPLVTAVVADPSLESVALNAIQLWTPGPATPPALRPDVAIAERLAAMRDQPALPADARRALTRVTRAAERKAGVLFPRAQPISGPDVRKSDEEML